MSDELTIDQYKDLLKEVSTSNRRKLNLKTISNTNVSRIMFDVTSDDEGGISDGEDDLQGGTEEEGEPKNTGSPTEIIEDERGPFHTLLKLGALDQMEKVYDCSDCVIKTFLFNVLPIGVGKRKWNKLVQGIKVSKFVSFSDEAFSMLVIENNSIKWIDELLNPLKKKQDLVKTKYTQNRGDSPGWSESGVNRFVDLCRWNCTDRRKDDNLIRKIDNLVEEKFLEGNRKRKRESKQMHDEYKMGLMNGDGNDNSAEQQKKMRNNNFLMQMMMKGSEYSEFVEL